METIQPVRRLSALDALRPGSELVVGLVVGGQWRSGRATLASLTAETIGLDVPFIDEQDAIFCGATVHVEFLYARRIRFVPPFSYVISYARVGPLLPWKPVS